MFNWLLSLIFRKPVVAAPKPAPRPVAPRPPVGGAAGPTAPKVVPRTGVTVAATLAAALAIAIPFTAGWEGFSSHVYRDSVGVKTICYGQTAADGADFSKVYTKQECMDMLGKDLIKYDADLKRLLKPDVYAALPPHRHAALISFDYNLGAGNTAHVAPYFNRGDWQAGCKAMLAYNRAGGQVLQGLVNRRRAEYALCIRSD